MPRKPLAIANWKMAMTIAESLDFVRDLQTMAGDCLEAVDVILCPPFTALWPLAQALGKVDPEADEQDTPSLAPDTQGSTQPTPNERQSLIQLGAQNMAPATDPAGTGQVSAALLADVGAGWVMLGHWEVRRHLGDDDTLINRKLHLALEAGLRPIPFVGEARHETASPTEALERQLSRILTGCSAEEVATMAFVYEPESAIGGDAPTSPEHVDVACTFMRNWFRSEWGEAAAQRARVAYGGSVAPEFAPELLSIPNLDGLAATRRGRDAATFVEIVRLIAGADKSGEE